MHFFEIIILIIFGIITLINVISVTLGKRKLSVNRAQYQLSVNELQQKAIEVFKKNGLLPGLYSSYVNDCGGVFLLCFDEYKKTALYLSNSIDKLFMKNELSTVTKNACEETKTSIKGVQVILTFIDDSIITIYFSRDDKVYRKKGFFGKTIIEEQNDFYAKLVKW